MKVSTVEIAWHNKEPIFSVDFHISGRLATAGGDNDVKIWKLLDTKERDLIASFTFLSSLKRHLKAVNTVRFSPNGEFLASGGDDGMIFVWKLNAETSVNSNALLLEGEESEIEEIKETWGIVSSLRGHLTDVYDLAWSPDSNHLVSGSTDNSAIIWDIQKGKSVCILKDHHHYVQGVAWDPLGSFIATQSCDRSARVYSLNKSRKEFASCVHVLQRVETSDKLYETQRNITPNNPQKLFGDETIQSFFRRLTWTPDGSCLLLPAGIISEKNHSSAIPQYATYLCARNSLQSPAMCFPAVSLSGTPKPPICVRANPLLFAKKQEEHEGCLLKLDYRMIFAVATLDTVTIYDTEQTFPLGVIEGIHYAEITDLAWSLDGLHLIISSKDGYVSLVTFGQNELGTKYSQTVHAL